MKAPNHQEIEKDLWLKNFLIVVKGKQWRSKGGKDVAPYQEQIKDCPHKGPPTLGGGRRWRVPTYDFAKFS